MPSRPGNLLEQENQRLRQEMAARDGFGEMIESSASMQEIYRLIQKVAQTPASVLITGETGTGKELVGRAIHSQGVRSGGPFIPLNCGALPENLLESELFGHRKGSFTGAETDRVGLFESANNGTLFLDEVGDVSPATQMRLLRILQEGEVTRLGESHPRPVDVRVVSATNKDLKAEVQAGRFREDLFFRLNVITLRLPPLRERREDILDLAMHFLARHCERSGTSRARCQLRRQTNPPRLQLARQRPRARARNGASRRPHGSGKDDRIRYAVVRLWPGRIVIARGV